MARASLRKSLRLIRHRNAYEPLEHREFRCLVIVPLDDFYSFVKQVCIIYVQMALIFFANVYTQIMAPHKNIGFLIIFFIFIFFFVLNGTKDAQLHVGHTRILHPPRPKIGP